MRPLSLSFHLRFLKRVYDPHKTPWIKSNYTVFKNICEVHCGPLANRFRCFAALMVMMIYMLLDSPFLSFWALKNGISDVLLFVADERRLFSTPNRSLSNNLTRSQSTARLGPAHNRASIENNVSVVLVVGAAERVPGLVSLYQFWFLRNLI